jgi:hypothetical protein
MWESLLSIIDASAAVASGLCRSLRIEIGKPPLVV